MKIAVVGCGAVGSFYGAKLCRDGQETHFLLRSDYEAVRRQGVSILSPEGDFIVHPKCAITPEQISVVDLVLIALKTTANDRLPKLLPPLVGPTTVILTLQNGLGNEERLAQLFPPRQIMGGVCFVCLNRLEPGVIHHLDHGRIVLGEFQRRSKPRTHDIASMFRHAGIPCEVTEDLSRAHWEKLVWNGLGVASCAGFEALARGEMKPDAPRGVCLTTDQLLADPRWEQLVRELMWEVVAAARGLGFEVDKSLAETHIARTRTMGAYKASTLVDFERGQPLEVESLFLEPLRQAKRAAVKTPRLEALCGVLSQLSR
jgi:2-dehydropantoate 2-reductase